MKILIRKARLSDAEDLAKLYLQFWEPHKKCDPLLEFKEKLTLKNQITAARKNIKKRNNYIFVAVNNKKVMGFIEFFVKNNPKIFKIREYGYLNSAVTHKSYRKHGVAKKLYIAAARLLKGKNINYIKTNIHIPNKVALKAWQKVGFKPQSYIMIKKI